VRAGWYKHVVVNGYQGTRSVYATDLDQDGDMDVVGAARYDNMIGWWENDGPGIWIEHIITTSFEGAWDVHAADIDGDNIIDVVGAAMTAGQVAWWQNTPERWQQQIISGWFPYAKGVFAADFNDDGLNDVLACSYGQNRVSWAQNNAGTWSEHILANQLIGVRAVHAADVNQDGDMDILAAADSAGIAYWENEDAVFSGQMMPGILWGARAVHAADLVGDQHLEILAASSRFDMIVYWFYDSNADEWVNSIVSDTFVFANDVYAGDLDSDGDIDILGGTYESDRVTWWENVDRNGTWIEHNVSVSANGTRSVFVEDVDGDGDNDILAACAHLRQIVWWENAADDALTMDLEPEISPIVIPHTGGTIEFTIHLNSTLNVPLTGRIFTDLRYLDGEIHNLEDPDSVLVFPGDNSYLDEAQIDADLPAGDYTLLISAGDGDDLAAVFDSLLFTKDIDTAVDDPPASLLNTFTVSQAYPNPFNSSTSIHVYLPTSSMLTVYITDIQGRLVRYLVSGIVSAGGHDFTVDLPNASSGIYLVKLAVPNQLSETRKIVLIK